MISQSRFNDNVATFRTGSIRSCIYVFSDTIHTFKLTTESICIRRGLSVRHEIWHIMKKEGQEDLEYANESGIFLSRHVYDLCNRATHDMKADISAQVSRDSHQSTFTSTKKEYLDRTETEYMETIGSTQRIGIIGDKRHQRYRCPIDFRSGRRKNFWKDMLYLRTENYVINELDISLQMNLRKQFYRSRGSS